MRRGRRQDLVLVDVLKEGRQEGDVVCATHQLHCQRELPKEASLRGGRKHGQIVGAGLEDVSILRSRSQLGQLLEPLHHLDSFARLVHGAFALAARMRFRQVLQASTLNGGPSLLALALVVANTCLCLHGLHFGDGLGTSTVATAKCLASKADVILASLPRALGNGLAHGQHCALLGLFAPMSRATLFRSKRNELLATLSSRGRHSRAPRHVQVIGLLRNGIGIVVVVVAVSNVGVGRSSSNSIGGVVLVAISTLVDLGTLTTRPISASSFALESVHCFIY